MPVGGQKFNYEVPLEELSVGGILGAKNKSFTNNLVSQNTFLVMFSDEELGFFVLSLILYLINQILPFTRVSFCSEKFFTQRRIFFFNRFNFAPVAVNPIISFRNVYSG